MINPILVLVSSAAKILFIIFLIALFPALYMSIRDDNTHWLLCTAFYGLIITSLISKITRVSGVVLRPVGMTHSTWDRAPIIGPTLNTLT